MADKAWLSTTVGQEVEVLTGFPFKSEKYTDEENSISLLRGDNIAQGTLRWDGAKRWSITDTENISNYFLNLGDVVLAMDRPWIEAGLKYACVSKHDLPCLLVQRVARLRAKDKLDQRFLRYIIASQEFTNYVLSVQTGTAVPHISGSQIKEFQFLCPPLAEQKAIAHILGTLDDKIELNREMNRTLETIAWTIFNSWFQENNFPETWQMLPLEQCMAEIIDYRGKTPKKTTSGIPLITAKIVKNGRISEPEEYIAIEDYDSWMRRGFPKCGDVVMTTEAPLGEIAQLDGRKVALAQRLITLRGKPGVIDNTYLRFLMLSSFVQEQLHARATGTTVLGIRQSELRKVNLVVPPFNEQIEISRTLDSLNSKINANDEQSITLSAIRDEFLPKLLSGKIRFGEIDSVLGEVG
ncbi:restriction endonuclease subunit S [Nostoc sp. JL33]|uniref:restriction endonuclease subunit S n=1 Tax=Nostoc sp. JL33 TaxID=2815396 RepID=UPI0025D1C69D|nr:restriction endonuclease subunit S [Nostoc sp. JL33]MBN3869521.1 restriction endonuclease subunit S [Nostoc sp. JL33]